MRSTSPLAADHRPGFRCRAWCGLLAGLLFVTTPWATTPARSAPPTQAIPSGDIPALIETAAQRFGLPAAWITAIMRVESANNVRAVSPNGAIGLMQIMPTTWTELRARYGLGEDPFDPRDNILAGAAYLRELHDRYGSPGFLAAYNAGPGRYEAYLAGRPLPRETRVYVARLLPLIGPSTAVYPIRPVESDAPSWTDAPLFMTQTSRTPTAQSVPTTRPSDDTATVSPEASPSLLPPRPGLFVPARKTGHEP